MTQFLSTCYERLCCWDGVTGLADHMACASGRAWEERVRVSLSDVRSAAFLLLLLLNNSHHRGAGLQILSEEKATVARLLKGRRRGVECSLNTLGAPHVVDWSHGVGSSRAATARAAVPVAPPSRPNSAASVDRARIERVLGERARSAVQVRLS